MALGFNKHVLVPDFPQMVEVRDVFAPAYVHTYKNGHLSPGDISKTLELISNKKEVPAPDLSKMNYNLLANNTLEFFNKLVVSTA
jgi:hypothetical protein